MSRSNPIKTIFFSSVFLFFSLACLAATPPEDPVSLFRQANAAYRGGDYAKAASLYENLIAQGKANAALYYNLGNTYFKQGRVGPALVQYERAKKMAPRDHDIRANLTYTKGLLEYRVEDKRNWYMKAWDAALSAFTQKEVGILSFALGLLFWLSWALSLYFRPETSWGWKRKTLLVLTVVAFSFWSLKEFHDLRVKEAIVLKPQAAVRYGPSYKDQVALRLGEGIKVRVAQQEGDWSRIVLVSGDTGWIPQEEIGMI